MNQNWKEEYWNLIFSDNPEAGIPLKDENFPNRFFKYRKLNENTIKCIEEDYIWMADIETLNDPFECSLQFDHLECSRHFFRSTEFQQVFKGKFGQELYQADIEAITTSKDPFTTYKTICDSRGIEIYITAAQQLERIQKRWAQILEESNKSLRVCSFSAINDSLLLWSHYSDDHKGICIEYDFSDAEPEIRAFLQPIIYRDKIYKIGLFEELTPLTKVCSTLIKSKDWAYEKEWRVSHFVEDLEKSQKEKVSKPKAVYLGTRFASNEVNLKNRLLAILADKSIPVYQITKHPTEYKLIPE